jgi:hypothetical protein
MVGQLLARMRRICVIDFAPEPGKPFCLGTVTTDIASDLLDFFQVCETHVSNQCFSNVDELDSQLSSMELSIQATENCRYKISDLQIYPSTGSVSFVLGERIQVGRE